MNEEETRTWKHLVSCASRKLESGELLPVGYATTMGQDDAYSIRAAEARIRQLEKAVRWAATYASAYVVQYSDGDAIVGLDFKEELLKRAGMGG